MAITTKKKKTTKESEDIIVCCRCGISKKPQNYYMSKSELYKHYGRMPVCKDCIDEIYNDLLYKNLNDEKKTVYDLCRLLDYPFYEKIYNSSELSAIKTGYKIYQSYMKDINSLGAKNNNGTDFSGSDSLESPLIENGEDNIEEYIKIFGSGYTNIEYVEMHDFFESLVNTYQCDTPIQVTLFKNISVLPIQMKRALSKNDTSAYVKLSDALSKILGDLQMKPSQESAIGDKTISTWGEWVKKIEETEPIPMVSKDLEDVDKIRKYVDKWFVKQMQRIMGIFTENDELKEELETLGQKGDSDGKL